MEKRFVEHLNKSQELSKVKPVTNYLAILPSQDKLLSVSSEEYVSHPVNAFCLMKRVTDLWPKFRSMTETATLYQDLLAHLKLPDKAEFVSGAAAGLMNAQVFHDLNVVQLARGRLIRRGRLAGSTLHFRINDQALINDQAKKNSKKE